MKRRPRIYYTETQKALMWERWKKGKLFQQIAKWLKHAYSRDGNYHVLHETIVI